jgi:hypothetical protein
MYQELDGGLELTKFSARTCYRCTCAGSRGKALRAAGTAHGQGDSVFFLAYLHAPLQCCFNLQPMMGRRVTGSPWSDSGE